MSNKIIKAELSAPYDEKQKIDFIVEYNHNQGYEIEEVDDKLQAFVMEFTEEEKEKAERNRLDMLYLTGADVERAIYQVKGIDFDDILAMVKDIPTIDEKALRIEFKANNFYRGNPYINQVGELLGFTSDMLDRFFDTKDYHYLTTCTLTINATPIEATVTGEGTYPYGTEVTYTVEEQGYTTKTGTITLLEDTTLEVVLDEDTTNTDQPTDVQDEV